MIKTFILSILGAAFFVTLCEMIIPDGSLKKYIKLTLGFVMISVLLSPFKNKEYFNSVNFYLESDFSEEKLLAESEAYVLQIHKDNIERRVREFCWGEPKIFIELFSDGRVKSVVIKGGKTEKSSIEMLKQELGCENIYQESDMSD